MTSLQLIRSKQRVNNATEEHAEAVKQRIEQENSAKFAPLKKIYDEVKHLPAKCYERRSVSWDGKKSLEGLWENTAHSQGISFKVAYSSYSSSSWDLSIKDGKFEECNRSDKRTTEDVEVAKGWLIDKIATLLLDEKAN